MQVAVIEYARNVLGLTAANSTEFDRNTPDPVIGLITEWTDAAGKVEQRNEDSDLGGTMRLGAQASHLLNDSLAHRIYGADTIVERHRHRYEVNNRYVDSLQQAGLAFGGFSENKSLVETIEIQNHPWFFACQFHPEFTSTPRDGHPLFIQFIQAAISHSETH